MIWDKKEKYLDNYIDYTYKNIDYTIQTSAFIINFTMINILIFYFTNIKKIGINGGLLSNKNNIVIK